MKIFINHDKFGLISGIQSESLNVVLPRSETRQGWLFSTLLLNIVQDALASAISKKNKLKKIGKERIEMSLFKYDTIIYIRNVMKSIN